jgi:hypothetical protein
MDAVSEQRPPQVEMQADWPSSVMALEMVVAVADSG